MDYLIWLGIAVVAYKVGYHVRGIVILANLSSDPKRTIALLEQLKALNEREQADPEIVSSDSVQLDIERQGDTLYGYRSDNREFVSQGPTLLALLDSAKLRWPALSFHGRIEKDNSAKEIA